MAKVRDVLTHNRRNKPLPWESNRGSSQFNWMSMGNSKRQKKNKPNRTNFSIFSTLFNEDN